MTATVSLTGFLETPAAGGAKVENIYSENNALNVNIVSGAIGGTAITVADGADVTLGAKADAVATSDTGTFSLIALIKRLLTKFSPVTNATVVAYVASQVAKASAGTLYRISGYNSGGAQFLQVHNTASLPADAAIPILLLAIPAQTNFYFDFGLAGRSFSTGITICNSSTGPTKTIGAADLWLDTQYT